MNDYDIVFTQLRLALTMAVSVLPTGPSLYKVAETVDQAEVFLQGHTLHSAAGASRDATN